MNREIKFRAWNGEKMMYRGLHDRNWYSEDHGGKLVEIAHPDDKRLLHVMEFTGLKDKNGKEIYEGDILSEKWKGEVYKNVEGTFMVKFHNNPSVNKSKSLFKYLKDREKAGCADTYNIIIGNVHENTELLTDQK